MTRVLSGVVLGAVFLALVWFSNATVLLGVAMVVSGLACHEYSRLMRAIGADLPEAATIITTLATLATVPFPYVALEAVVGIGVLVIALSAMVRTPRGSSSSGDDTGQAFQRAVRGSAAGALSMVYLGIPLGALVGTHIFGGRNAVLLLIATIVVSDTAQYYVGRLTGRRQLAPRLSPNKTIEGVLGGFVAVPIFLYFAGPQLIPVARPSMIALLGVVLVAAGIVGDLFESMLKRAAGLKDSSSLIPGHGGVLDRIDALLLATPVFYLYVRWVYTI
jgi:phosphatidate cytidylyltransferase